MSPPVTPKPSNGIKAVCFDLDGVLVDAADWHKKALDKSLEFWGFKPIPDDEHKTLFNGLSTFRKLQMLSSLGRIPNVESVHQVIYRDKQKFTIQTIEELCDIDYRVVEAVKKAKEYCPNNVAVVTNCSRHTAEMMLTMAGLYDLIDHMVCNEDVRGRIKPHPWPYLKAKTIMGLANQLSKSCFVVEDTDKGVIAAVEAGMRVWRLNSFEELTAEGLEFKLNSLRITI